MWRILVTFSITLMLKVRVRDIQTRVINIPKRLRNTERWKNKNSPVNCLIT